MSSFEITPTLPLFYRNHVDFDVIDNSQDHRLLHTGPSELMCDSDDSSWMRLEARRTLEWKVDVAGAESVKRQHRLRDVGLLVCLPTRPTK